MSTTPESGLLDHWYVLCLGRNLHRRPLAARLFGQRLVLFRREDGRPAALVDRCPHRNAPLSDGRVLEGRIECPYHGWTFDGDGSCQEIPGRCEESAERTGGSVRNVLTHAIVEQDGLVWVHARPGPPPAAMPPEVPAAGDRAYQSFTWSVDIPASLPNALENFLDATHTHTVHSGLIRRTTVRKPIEVVVRRTNLSVEAEYVDEGQQTGLISRLFGGGITNTFGRFRVPSTAQLEYRTPQFTKMWITVFVTPIADRQLQAFVVVTGRGGPIVGRLIGWIIRPFFRLALRQDLEIMARQERNIERFGEERYVHSELDLLRGHIDKLLARAPALDEPEQSISEKRIRMLL